MHTAVHVRIRYNMHKILQYANVTNGSISMQLPLLLKNWSKKKLLLVLLKLEETFNLKILKGITIIREVNHLPFKHAFWIN